MEEFKCPSRIETPHLHLLGIPDNDNWREAGGTHHCSYCGSLHPDEFLKLASGGSEITPTDKSYKVYIKTDNFRSKFYFQHLSNEQQDEFITLVNSKVMKLTYPGYFYTLPYFCKGKTET